MAMMALLTNTHKGKRVATRGRHRTKGLPKLFGRGKWDHEDLGYVGKHRG